MQKRQLTSIGLFVYATILVTSFLHVLEAFLAYSHPVQLGPLVIPGWIAGVGVALSSFVPLTSLRIGQVLAEVSRMDARPGREEAGVTLSGLARRIGLDGGMLVKACGQAVGVSRITQGGLARNGALIPGRPAHQH